MHFFNFKIFLFVRFFNATVSHIVLFFFHDELVVQYQKRLSGEMPLLHRMKEMWGFWQNNIPDSPDKDKLLKKLFKTKNYAEYSSLANALFSL